MAWVEVLNTDSARDKVYCLLDGCSRRGAIQQGNIGKHVYTMYLNMTEMACTEPGCKAVLSRNDGLADRHILTVHRRDIQ